MMMKIIGAVLIVSGGYFIGKVSTIQRRNRLVALRETEGLFRLYEQQMREYRKSLEEVLSGQGFLAEQILKGEAVKGFLSEDLKRLESTVSQLKMGTYSESMEANDSFLNYLTSVINQLEEETSTMGKAIPLVAGAIGLLVAVLLF